MIVRFLLFISFLFLGCSPKAVDPQLFNPFFLPVKEPRSLAVYDTHNERIVFYDLTFQNEILFEKSWAKTLPFRVEFLDLWVSGLGHDIRRLTHNHAETIKDALMYAAKKEGMKPLHVNQSDYIIDENFAKEMVFAIKAYEERMERYNKDREFPFLLLPRH